MEETAKLLAELADVGRRLVEHGKRLYGRGWNQVAVDVSVYWADDGNHTSIEIKKIKIAYFEPCDFALRLHHITKLPEILDFAKATLKELDDEYDNQDAAEKARKIEDRKAALRQELDELEGNSV